MSEIYLYGIVEGDAVPHFIASEIAGAGPVYTVACDGISCVVSDYEGEPLSGMTKESLIQTLLAHQLVVEQVMPGRTVLPTKFGTVLAGPDEVMALLCQGHGDFLQALEANRGRVEMEVAATWDTGRVLMEIGGEEEVVQARGAFSLKGQPTVAERIALGQIVKSQVDLRREHFRKRIMGHLKRLAVDAVPNALVSDELVVNVAFLVNQDQRLEFDKGIQQLDELYQGEINFRVIGPLPPYSFSTIEVSPINPAQLAKARHILQLEDALSVGAVRRGYRRLAAREQRGIAAGDQLAVDRFFKLRKASDLLLGALGSGPAATPIPGGPRFLINIKRPAGEAFSSAPLPGMGRRQQVA